MAKICNCGKQGKIINSRQRELHVYRRYECSCGLRWSSCEVRVDDDVPEHSIYAHVIKNLTIEARNDIADKLIELAQGLLK